MKNIISVTDNLHDILCRPEFAGHADAVQMVKGPVGSILNRLSLRTLCRMVGTWNPESVADGLNFLSERASSGPVFYDIWSDAEKQKDPEKKNTALAAFLQPKASRFAVICAGGGYSSVASLAEAFPSARIFYEMGYSAFVLKYRIGNGRDTLAPKPVEDLAQAVRLILTSFPVRMDNYAVVGFSAGGHVAASFACDDIGCRSYGLPGPGAVLLAYPLITMGKAAPSSVRRCFLGKAHQNDAEWIHRYSVEEQITPNYPPTFVWQCVRDDTCPVQNSKMLVQALEANRVPCRYEVFPGTAHGWGEGRGTAAEGWVLRAIHFWESSI